MRGRSFAQARPQQAFIAWHISIESMIDQRIFGQRLTAIQWSCAIIYLGTHFSNQRFRN
jgi:hypothetical protein